MLLTTRAIVLRAIRHGDRTAILKTYTEHDGARACALRLGGRSGAPHALVQPLSRVELVLDQHPDKDLAAVKEIRLEAPSVPQDRPERAAVVLFLQEVFLRVLRTECADAGLFAFAHAAIGSAVMEQDLAQVPLRTMAGLIQHMGILPSPPEHGEPNFDLLEGRFIAGDAPSGHTLRQPLSTWMAALFDEGATELPRLSAAQRRDLLDHLLLFIRLHLDGFGELRSVSVLREVLA